MKTINRQSTGSIRTRDMQYIISALTCATPSTIMSKNSMPVNDTALRKAEDIELWIKFTDIILAKENDNDDDDDFQDPDADELLRDMFPDEDDDFWSDNYDID